ncbi:MAG: prepilin peptidase [bacterium]
MDIFTACNYLFVFLCGLCFGSFANVIIFRLPRKISIVFPRSHCVTCLTPISWFDNIPLISYMLLKGTCRRCGHAISSRYIIIELLTAVIFTATYAYCNRSYIELLIFLVFNFMLIVITFIDIDFQIIPDELSLSLIAIGIVFAPFNSMLGDSAVFNLIKSISGGLAGGLFLLSVALITEKILKKDTLGGGDIKLIAGIGVLLGLEGVFYTILFASLCGSLVGLSLIALKKLTRGEPIPFGPFLSLAAIFVLFLLPHIKHMFPVIPF